MHVIPKSRMNQTHSHHFFPVSGSGAAKRNATQRNPIGRGDFYALGKGTPIKLSVQSLTGSTKGEKRSGSAGWLCLLLFVAFLGGLHACMQTWVRRYFTFPFAFLSFFLSCLACLFGIGKPESESGSWNGMGAVHGTLHEYIVSTVIRT